MDEQNNPAKEGGESLGGDLPVETPKVVNGVEDAKPATQQQLQEVKDEMNSFERASIRWMKVTAGIGVVTACFICLQWCEMKSGGVDTKHLAEAASGQLGTMRELARAASGQAGSMQVFADRMKDQSDRTKDLAETAQKSLEVENRPWLSAEIAKSDSPLNNGDLTFDGDGSLRVWFTVKGQNFGKSIAQDIHVYANIFATRIGDVFVEIPKWQSEVCDKPKPIYVRPGIQFVQGFDRFPGQSYERGIGTVIDKAVVVRESSFFAADPGQHRYINRLYLVGCVDYRFSFGKDRHQTRFAYDIVKMPDSSVRDVNGIPLMEFQVGSNLMKDQYAIFPSLEGSSYAY